MEKDQLRIINDGENDKENLQKQINSLAPKVAIAILELNFFQGSKAPVMGGKNKNIESTVGYEVNNLLVIANAFHQAKECLRIGELEHANEMLAAVERIIKRVERDDLYFIGAMNDHADQVKTHRASIEKTVE